MKCDPGRARAVGQDPYPPHINAEGQSSGDERLPLAAPLGSGCGKKGRKQSVLLNQRRTWAQEAEA